MRGDSRGVCCARLYGTTHNGMLTLLLSSFEHLAYGLLSHFLESICLACVCVCRENFAGILMCGLSHRGEHFVAAHAATYLFKIYFHGDIG